ncbi:MAG: M23 family metallopeptidase [Termitinemataceae bacterium]
MFVQFQTDVEENRMQLARYEMGLSTTVQDQENGAIQRLIQGLTIYQYTVQKGDDIFALAARCSLPYETIATINRLSHPTHLKAGQTLLLPSLPGLYIATEARNDLERLLVNAYHEVPSARVIVYPAGTPETFYCVPGKNFSGTERAFFLHTAFRYPLPVVQITSSFGIRKNPVSGNIVFHQGIDLAAPRGTPVYACRQGVVSFTGTDDILGNYVIIEHEGGWSSLYGHLDSIETSLHSSVLSGTVIGKVGSTGQSTGSHLHFELRQNGRATDPFRVLPKKRE